MPWIGAAIAAVLIVVSVPGAAQTNLNQYLLEPAPQGDEATSIEASGTMPAAKDRGRIWAALDVADRIAQMFVAIGRSKPNVVSQALADLARGLERKDAEAAPLAELLLLYRDAADDFFDAIEIDIEISDAWPADRAAAKHRASAGAELARLRTAHEAARDGGEGARDQLIQAYRVLARAYGQATVADKDNPIAGHIERIEAAMPQCALPRPPTGTAGAAGLQLARAAPGQPAEPLEAPAQTLLDTIVVPADKPAAITGRTILEDGRFYTIEASGTFSVWPDRDDGVDALWCHHPALCGQGGVPWEQLRIGGESMLALARRNGTGDNPLPYNPEHAYRLRYQGQGKSIELSILNAVEGCWRGNRGAITVKVYVEKPATSAVAPRRTPKPPPRPPAQPEPENVGGIRIFGGDSEGSGITEEGTIKW